MMNGRRAAASSRIRRGSGSDAGLAMVRERLHEAAFAIKAAGPQGRRPWYKHGDGLDPGALPRSRLTPGAGRQEHQDPEPAELARAHAEGLPRRLGGAPPGAPRGAVLPPRP